MKVAAPRIAIAVVLVLASSGFATGLALPALEAQPLAAMAEGSATPILSNASWETMLRSIAR